MERWLSGPKRGFAKPLSLTAHVGSNPTLSACVKPLFLVPKT